MLGNPELPLIPSIAKRKGWWLVVVVLLVAWERQRKKRIEDGLKVGASKDSSSAQI